MSKFIMCEQCKIKKECKLKDTFIRAQNFLNMEQEKKDKENILNVTCKNREM